MSTPQALVWQDDNRRKRKRTGDPDEAVSKGVDGSAFRNGESVREQARPFRILTARMPVRPLTSTWSQWKNRPVDLQHVHKLSNIFAQGGLGKGATLESGSSLCLLQWGHGGRRDESSPANLSQTAQTCTYLENRLEDVLLCRVRVRGRLDIQGPAFLAVFGASVLESLALRLEEMTESRKERKCSSALRFSMG